MYAAPSHLCTAEADAAICDVVQSPSAYIALPHRQLSAPIVPILSSQIITENTKKIKKLTSLTLFAVAHVALEAFQALEGMWKTQIIRSKI